MRNLWLPAWPSPRFLWGLVAIAAVFALGSLSIVTVWVAAALMALLLVLFAADLIVGPRRDELMVERIGDEHFSLRAIEHLRYRITNTSEVVARIGLIEAPLPQLRFLQDEIGAAVPARSQVEVERAVLPVLRGPVTLGTVYLWFENALGLVRRRVRVILTHELRVYPDLSMVERYGKLHTRNRLIEAGLRKMRLRGIGTEFESLREWSSGDQFRAINWKATARRGKLIVTHHEVERSQNIMLLLDCGRLMTPRIDEQRKFDYAITAALSAATIAGLANDKVGFVAFANQILFACAPRSGKVHLAEASQHLYDLEPRFEESDYGRAFAYVRSHLHKRSLVVLFTDMFDPVASATILSEIGVLARRHLVLCVLMSDAAIEAALAKVPAQPLDVYRASVAASLAEERRAARAILAKSGVRVIDAPAAKLTMSLIDAYLDIKRRALL